MMERRGAACELHAHTVSAAFPHRVISGGIMRFCCLCLMLMLPVRPPEMMMKMRTLMRAGYVTLMRCFGCRLFERPDDGISLRFGGQLLLQFLVDACAIVEQSKLFWVRLNQVKIRSELYSGMLRMCVSFLFHQ